MCPVVRLNRGDGKPHIERIEEWEFTPHHDLAVAPFGIDGAMKAGYVHEDLFVAPKDVATGQIVPGDHVFMTGRFVTVDGKLMNTPSARFGNLSMMPTQVPHESYGSQESFVVEMRSMCGYSGSPCFLTPAIWDLRTNEVKMSGRLFLLGVHWGYVTEHSELHEKIVKETQTAGLREGERVVRYIAANTGMDGVVPAWHVKSLLDCYKDMRAARDCDLMRQRGEINSETKTSS